VWDVRPAEAYARGHIAGAINIGDAARLLRDDNTEDFIPTDRIEKILGAAGLDPSRETIVYGSRGTWQPYFGLYTFQYFNGKNVRVYHEGIEGWTAAGRTISRDASHLPLVTLKLESSTPKGFRSLAMPRKRSRHEAIAIFLNVRKSGRAGRRLRANRISRLTCRPWYRSEVQSR
jgi:thiosulfate/3-mercaptopyruvate sulfurtransferase